MLGLDGNGHSHESGGCAENWDSEKETVRRNYAGKQMSGGGDCAGFSVKCCFMTTW